MLYNDKNGLGRVEVTDIPMPEYVKNVSATYTYSGKVLVFYNTDSDQNIDDYLNIAVVNDDGSEFSNIFSGIIHQHKKANGIRHMPFQDNKRALLGDYILECEPDIDNCQSAKLIPVKYPWLIEHDPRTMKHWSEIIIAPDNKHISWTILRTDIGAANMIGVLKRKRNKYVIRKPQIISSLNYFKKDKKNKGYIKPQLMRGGEVKQFVRGGTAISLVGASIAGSPDSIVQDLKSNKQVKITNTPGYDETTIFSPDERLGIVMSTRGSEKTDPAIFGLMPRPYGIYTMQGLIMHLYMYAVAGVRGSRKGNIGPVLIDIERSRQDQDYKGILLNDPEDRWVYVSPMSWHPDGKKAMWQEMLRGSEGQKGGKKIRFRKVILKDYQPHETVPVRKTPDDIPYGIKGIKGALKLWFPPDINIGGRIAGKHSGFLEYKRVGKKPMQSIHGHIESKYIDFSDDGKTFYNGYEKVRYSYTEKTKYEGNLEMTGEDQGEIKLRAVFSKINWDKPVNLLFDKAEDGKAKTHGYVKYNGIKLNIEDMAE